jgi:hypothetical protein
MSRKIRKEFNGVVVYPKKVPPQTTVMVGAWIAHSLTVGQLQKLMRVAKQCIGQMEVHTQGGAATITYEIPDLPRRGDVTRQTALFLSRLVKHATGEQSILQELRSSREVRLALAAA